MKGVSPVFVRPTLHHIAGENMDAVGARRLCTGPRCRSFIYHLVVVFLEEPNPSAERGPCYDDYRREVPLWLGWPKRLDESQSR
jgi:hypothetical protein